MNAVIDSSLARAKDRLTVLALGPILFPGWEVGRSCRSPFREDRHASFSVFADGRAWKDFTTGEAGDAVDFIAKAHGLSKADAVRALISMAGTNGLPALRSLRPVLPAVAHPARDEYRPMPTNVASVWEEGVTHLLANPRTQGQVETWRSWPAGTVTALAEGGLIGCPLVRGQRGTAFPVQVPFRDELGILSTFNVGFHFRHKPPVGEMRVSWSYHSAGSCPALPFVLGAGFLPFAEIVVVTEGQWDAVTLAAAAGWLASNAAWPERVAVFGLRGAGTWRAFLDSWGDYWPKPARLVLFADADEAGEGWRLRGGFKDALTKRGHAVRFARPRGAKDVNDLHRIQRITAEAVAGWITPKEKSP